MDKATLLAEVIRQVKHLKKNADEASKGYSIPTDDDEVKVEPYENGGSFLYKASISCDYRPELLSDLRQTLDKLQLQLALSSVLERASTSMDYSLRTPRPCKQMQQTSTMSCNHEFCSC
ncbi:transcription factor [Medicago truncatula]|nr:transcription factor [Medicago truncatula]